MSDAEKAEKTESHAPAPKPKSKLVPILMGVVFLLLAGGGAAAYWMYGSAGEEGVEPPSPSPGVVTLDPFVVNLADEGNRRFLRVHLNLLTWDEHQAEELEEDQVGHARIRSSILELLSLQYAAPLMTPQGKEELKEAIAERAEAAVEHLEITDVLFVEFVVQ
jgi:flagellar FliL protein